ncbi:prolipoprotein diacylglyceryl transferase [Paenibacillus sp.]|jgi:phosphatidylglycerol:prolipoprotein diacylglycerol transferase|uniref:prolipoprotein diacylglyceryl transferase n=1 Tax=Paenibacillus sp. TaxID=58172 RepID=UPI00282861F0|nr:prolipoprotein diacylglyceryl transferase [Paenibacillus sp.]MDR0268910.1 prolipoprotein diacylglyceryl transferase [Paenibacillus sp.]
MATLLLNPIAFSIGSLSVHWYGLILGLGALAGLLLAIREGKRFGIQPEFFMDLLLLGVPSAIIGARIYFVAFKWDDYKDHLIDVFKIWNGGIAIYGALIGAIICAIFYFRYKGYDFWRIADICAPGLLTGQMIGRWGNFVNQEAYGGPAGEFFLRDRLHLPNFIVDQMNVQGVYHHPTFLYESLWSFVGIIILFILRRQRFLRAAELFLSYFIWYSIGRFFIEALRTDSLAFIGPNWLASLVNGLWQPMEWMGFEHGELSAAYGNVRISQLLAILIIVVAVAMIIVRRLTGKAEVRYLDPIYSTKASPDNVPEAITQEYDKEEEAAPAPSISDHMTEDAEDKKE